MKPAYSRILLPLGVTLLLSGCSLEEPFNEKDDSTVGMLKTSALAPSLNNPEGYERQTRAGVPATDDFKVVITRNGFRAPEAEYRYADMPEVLTLPVGDYKVYAHHGENRIAAWEEPYYYGESTFAIEENKITDEVDPIVAKLSNIKVTIIFHPTLQSSMSPDSKVTVKVGDEGVLTFTGTENRCAYFRYVNNSQTLAATFTGTVDGDYVSETRTHEDVAPGNHYRITFRLHGIDQDEDGKITGNVTVDTTVEQVDMNKTVDGAGDDPLLTDDKRPNQGGGEDPGPGPVEPTGPEITAAMPTESGKVPVKLGTPDDDIVNEVTDDTYCVLNISSSAPGGIKGFTVEIDSPTLTPDELSNVGLSSVLDLVNPGSLEEPLDGLGLPVNVGGKDKVTFNITGFLGLLGALGEGTHVFTLKVSDGGTDDPQTWNTSIAILRLHTN